MRVRFFGVRGSAPTPGPSTLRYGGNTSCVEVRLHDGSIVILDAGTGMRELGKVLVEEGVPRSLSLLITHMHFDHIIGMPFFAPLYRPETHLRVFPAATREQSEARRKMTLFDGVHFPIRPEAIPARVEFVGEKPDWKIGSATVKPILLNHPGTSMGYLIRDGNDRSLAFLTDNELSTAPSPERYLDELAEFCRGVDVLIHDAQYLDSEMPKKRGWGHSTVEGVLELGRRARPGHLVLFHHDPDRDDDQLDEIAARATRWMAEHAPGTRVVIAAEGVVMELPAAR